MAFDVELPDGRVIKDVPDGTTKEQIAAKLGASAPQPANPFKETAKTVGSALYEGATSLPRLVKEGGDYLESKFPTPSWMKVPIPGAEAIGAVDEAARSALRPDTETGRTIANIGAAGVGAIAGPGGLAAPVKSGIIGLSAGGGSELSAKLFGDNVMSRLLGGLAGGGTAGLAAALTPTAKSMTKTALKGMTQADWDAAKAAEATLQREGLPHLKSQLLGASSSLDDVVSQASSHPEVRPSLLAATRDIAPKAQQSTEVWKAGNLPVAVEERRGLLLDVQKAAKEADRQAVGRSNAAYTQSMPTGGAYSEAYITALKDDLKKLAESNRYGPTTAGGKAITRFADEHLTLPPGESMPAAHLNNLVKDLNTISMQEGWKGLPVGDIKTLLKSYTPEFDAARAAKTGVMQAEVTPMRQGLAGDIARMGGGPNDNKYTVTGDVLKLVFAADKAQPQAIAKLGADIGQDQVGHLLREHLTRSMELASKGLDRTHGAPAKFAEALAGTPAQRANLDAALKVVAQGTADPAAVRRGFNELIHAFGTYKDLKLTPGVSGANLGFEAGKSIPGMLVAPASRTGRWLWERATAKTYQKIADMVTSPDGLKQLEQIARAPDQKVKGAVLRGIISGMMVDDNSPELPDSNPPE